MSEQLALPFPSGEVTGKIHVVSELGPSSAVYLQGLASASIEAVLAAENIVTNNGTYHDIHRMNGVAWVDFTLERSGSSWLAEQARTTYLSVGREQRGAHRYDFRSAEELMHEGALPAYTAAWLRRLVLVDRPHPPMPPGRTDTIRDVARFLPPLSQRQYMRNAVRHMPSLKDYYRQFGYNFSD